MTIGFMSKIKKQPFGLFFYLGLLLAVIFYQPRHGALHNIAY